MVPGAGLEPAWITPKDFKSFASTDFATRAGGRGGVGAGSEGAAGCREGGTGALRAGRRWRLSPESNRGTRLCRPLHDHSATQPVNGFSPLADEPCRETREILPQSTRGGSLPTFAPAIPNLRQPLFGRAGVLGGVGERASSMKSKRRSQDPKGRFWRSARRCSKKVVREGSRARTAR